MFWLVLAFTQDHPGDKYSVEFRDACERAAVEGYWVRCCPPTLGAALGPMRVNCASSMLGCLVQEQ